MQKIKDHFGIKLDLSVKDFTKNDRSYLIDLLGKHKIVFFKNTKLTYDELLEFSNIFSNPWSNKSENELAGNGEKTSTHPYSNNITRVSNKNLGVLRDWYVPWHSDVSHKPWDSPGGTLPFRVLYAVTLPPDEKTHTSWFDQEYVYTHCPVELKNLVENIQAEYKAIYNTAWVGNTMPFTLTNPITNKKSFSVSDLFFEKFKDFDYDTSKDIINQLLKIATMDQNVLDHVWEPDDLCIYNNFNTAHQRSRITSTYERTLWRVTLQIPELVPFELRV